MEYQSHNAYATLSRRNSNQVATSYARRQLTDIKERTLVEYINKLSDQGLPPTPQIVKSLAEEIASVMLGKNWVARFCERHQDRVLSAYLDHKRKLADNPSTFSALL